MRIFCENGRHRTRMVGERPVGNEKGRWKTDRHRMGMVG